MSRQEFFHLVSGGFISEAINFAISSGTDKDIFFAALGDHFFESKQIDLARSFYIQSLREFPNPYAQFGLGRLLLSEGMIKESIPFLLEASKSDAHAVGSLLKLGMAERLLGNIERSLSAYLLARNKGYDRFIIDVNIAVLLSDMGDFETAGMYYERAMSKAPDDPRARFNYSLHLLSLGEFKLGLEYYESRPWCFRGFGKEWSGEKGQRVLVLSEQGYGDLIQFSRFITEVKRVSEKVALACDPKMFSLFSSIGIDDFFDLDESSLKSAGELYPRYCRVMSIPFLMSLDPSSVNFKPFSVDYARASRWRSSLKTDGLLKVGLCWQGGKRNHSEMIFNDRKRSIDLDFFEPILGIDGLEFHSLQKDWKEPHPRITDRMGECDDFLDTASFIDSMDLVISVDTAVAHLAASMGKPVWMLSRLGGCWRWGNHGEDTFWYPSMRIFRQTKMDDWSQAIEQVKNNLVFLLKNS